MPPRIRLRGRLRIQGPSGPPRASPFGRIRHAPPQCPGRTTRPDRRRSPRPGKPCRKIRRSRPSMATSRYAIHPVPSTPPAARMRPSTAETGRSAPSCAPTVTARWGRRRLRASPRPAAHRRIGPAGRSATQDASAGAPGRPGTRRLRVGRSSAGEPWRSIRSMSSASQATPVTKSQGRMILMSLQMIR